MARVPTPNYDIGQGFQDEEDNWGPDYNKIAQFLDSNLFLHVQSRTTTTPPSPTNTGNRWIIPTGATGAWAGQIPGTVAYDFQNAWVFWIPIRGWKCRVQDESDAEVYHNGTEWVVVSAMGDNIFVNGALNINQRVVSGTVSLASGDYGHDRLRGGGSGCTYTFSSTDGITELNIASGSLESVIESASMQSGNYTLSWSGSAQASIDGGGPQASPIVFSANGTSNVTIEFSTGTITRVRVELGSIPTPFVKASDAEELIRCQRYYEKSYNLDVEPGSSSIFGACTGTAASTEAVSGCRFSVAKRVAPTVSIYSTLGALGAVNPLGGGSNVGGGNSANLIGTTGFGRIDDTSAFTAASVYRFHYTADADF